MSAANWISGAVRGKKQARVDRKLRRRKGATEGVGETAVEHWHDAQQGDCGFCGQDWPCVCPRCGEAWIRHPHTTNGVYSDAPTDCPHLHQWYVTDDDKPSIACRSCPETLGHWAPLRERYGLMPCTSTYGILICQSPAAGPHHSSTLFSGEVVRWEDGCDETCTVDCCACKGSLRRARDKSQRITALAAEESGSQRSSTENPLAEDPI